MSGGGRRFRDGTHGQRGHRDAHGLTEDIKARVSAGARQVGRRTRGWWLLVPVPVLVIALIVKAFGQDWLGLLAVAFALFAVFQGWFMIRQGLAIEFKDEGRKIAPGRFPWRLIGAKVVGAAAFSLTFMFATLADPLVVKLIKALAADAVITGAVLLAFGFDRMAARGLAEAAAEAGMPKSDLIKAFNEANGKIDRLEHAASATMNPALRGQLFEIAGSARRVVRQIEDDPRDLRRARRFLATYLDSATKIASDFQSNQGKLASTAMETKYASLLDTILQTFEEQEQKLDRDDHLDLDVRIEVLKTQMEREGL